jgi:hypothetical protein
MTPGERGRQYDLNEVYRTVFGYTRPVYPTLLIESGKVGYNPVGLFKSLRGAFDFASSLGNDFALPTKLNGYQLPNEPTIRITGGKNIIETKLTRLDSFGKLNKANVLEEINQNNFRIRIQGIITNDEDPNDYPEQAVRQLSDIFLNSGSVKIENALCSLWGITSIAIENFDMREVRGGLSTQAYDIIGYSDEFVDLEIAEPERRT